MINTPAVRKFARRALTTAVAGTGVAFLLLGAPADAATLIGAASRGI